MRISSIQLLILLLFCLKSVHCNPDIAGRSYSTSVIAMTDLLEAEHFMKNAIEVNYSRLGKKGNIVRSFIEKLNKEHEKATSSPEAFLSNPLNNFALLRRMYADWPTILYYMDELIRSYIYETLAFHEFELPISEDMMEAAVGLERIRRTYNLYPLDIAQGRLNGIKYDARLLSSDLYEIGFQLFKMRKYAEAASWLKVGLETDFEVLVPNEISDFNEDLIKVLYLDTLKQKDQLDAEEVANEDTDDYFERRCRGEELSSISNQFCRYNTSFNPFYVLAPFKMEELSRDPYVVIFHDVLTDVEMDKIKSDARDNLWRAHVFTEGKTYKPDVIRTTHSGTVDLKNDTMKKILDITGLNPDGFEMTSILNYGLGGHYITHYDYFNPLKEDWLDLLGDRIATILIYLSDVEQGGETIFPDIGLSVKPRKGSLLLWYNLKNNGEIDENTIHGACPVIFGSKWAATIWVREKSQFRTLPCYNP